jgi:hypothetical protein
MNLQRIRGFLLLTLQDVENGAGVPAYRLSKAERGQLRLNEAEQSALRSYYAARWRMAVSDETPTEQLLGKTS